MKQLALMRHAKSSWKHPELSDHDRPLNKRGRHDAPLMGKRLADRGFSTQLMVSSTAKRAAVTAAIVAEAIGYPRDTIREEPQLYLAHPDTVVETARALPEQVQRAMFFGHNPSFTILANELGDLTLDNLPTSGVAVFEFDIDTWREIAYGKGRVALFDFPKNSGKV